MPNADGRFLGQGWSQARSDGWTKAFGPALADDPSPDDELGPCSTCDQTRDNRYLLMCLSCVRSGVPIPPVPDDLSYHERRLAERLEDPTFARAYYLELGIVLPDVPSEPAREVDFA